MNDGKWKYPGVPLGGEGDPLMVSDVVQMASLQTCCPQLPNTDTDPGNRYEINQRDFSIHILFTSKLLCPWGFSRQEYWNGLPCPPPEDLPNSGIKPKSPMWQVDSLPSEPPGKPSLYLIYRYHCSGNAFNILWSLISQFSHSVVSDSLRPHELHQASLSITNSRSSLRLMSIESVMPFSHLILCRPLLLLPPVPPSSRVFPNESTLRMRWPKSWSFSFRIIPSKEHPALISFRMDWLDLLAIQGPLKSLLQHHSSKASILWCSAFFTVQLSHLYMTTGKTRAMTRWNFVGKVYTSMCI